MEGGMVMCHARCVFYFGSDSGRYDGEKIFPLHTHHNHPNMKSFKTIFLFDVPKTRVKTENGQTPSRCIAGNPPPSNTTGVVRRQSSSATPPKAIIDMINVIYIPLRSIPERHGN